LRTGLDVERHQSDLGDMLTVGGDDRRVGHE
jgi:hypothetical protein